MGALVPFPTVKAQAAALQAVGKPIEPAAPYAGPAKVIILPVVQYVRPTQQAASVAVREPR